MLWNFLWKVTLSLSLINLIDPLLEFLQERKSGKRNLFIEIYILIFSSTQRFYGWRVCSLENVESWLHEADFRRRRHLRATNPRWWLSLFRNGIRVRGNLLPEVVKKSPCKYRKSSRRMKTFDFAVACTLPNVIYPCFFFAQFHGKMINFVSSLSGFEMYSKWGKKRCCTKRQHYSFFFLI